MRLGLLDLPVELLECILDYADPLDKPTFYQLSRVSKTMNSLVTPLLYHTVDFKSHHIRRPGAMLRRFVITILSSKERASLVKDFTASSKVPAEKIYFPATTTAERIMALAWGFAPESLVRQASETFTIAIVDNNLRNHRFELLQLFAAVCLPNLTRLAFEGSSDQRVFDIMDAVLDSFAAHESVQSSAAVWPVLEEVAIEGMYAPMHQPPLQALSWLCEDDYLIFPADSNVKAKKRTTWITLDPSPFWQGGCRG